LPQAAPTPRPLVWVGSSRGDLRALPEAVQARIGYALYQAQIGLRHASVKTLRGLGPGVLEVATDFEGGTFRAVYTVRFQQALYVLHVFQKKSKSGSSTPKSDIDLIELRLKRAAEHYRQAYPRGAAR
jgi:phage-related protein